MTTLPRIGSSEEWLAARKALLAKEKEETRRRDALRAERRELPMVEVEKDYRFEGPDGEVGLADIFEGRRQLLVQHFMFDPEWEDGCSSCTYGLDTAGSIAHLHEQDTTFAVVARAPFEKLEAYRQKRGWTMPWYSSFGSDFNYDYHVTLDASVAPIEFNFRTAAEHEEATGAALAEGEYPGYSVFLRDGDRVFHTYSMYARGAELLGWSTQALDLTWIGRVGG